MARVAIVSTEEPDPVIESGLNVPVAPAGSPLTVKLAVPVNEPEEVTVVVKVVLLPSSTERVPGVWESQKSFAPTCTWVETDGTPALFSRKIM